MNIFTNIKSISILFLWLVICIEAFQINAQHIMSDHKLPNLVHETSGLIFLNGKLITFNDSGGENKLYEIDPLNGNLVKEVILNGSQNVDWEDICQDEDFIYLADIGNNNGSRKDLKIYLVQKSDYENALGSVEAYDSITFRYKDQTTFETKWLKTSYDAETLLSYGDHLYLFTKNWLNRWTVIYKIPKVSGDYEIEKIDSIAVPGVITGGTYNEDADQIVLTGYNTDSVFLTLIEHFTESNFNNGLEQHLVLNIPEGASVQVESICAVDENHYYMTAERTDSAAEMLYKLRLGLEVGNRDIQKQSSITLDKHAQEVIVNNFCKNSHLFLYNMTGKRCKQSCDGKLDIRDLRNGLYLAVLKNSETKLQEVKKLTIHR